MAAKPTETSNIPAAKPTGTSINPSGNDLMITLNNGTRLSTDYWGHIKARRASGNSQRGGKVKKQIWFISVFENGRQTQKNIHYSRRK